MKPEASRTRRAAPGRRGLAMLLAAAEKHDPAYQGGRLPIEVINVLAQPRKTFENIPELALDVARKGLLNPPTVARFSCEDCATFIETVNRLWGTEFKIDSVKPVREGRTQVYYVLLAGERRFRACKLLWEHGCLECQEARNGKPVPVGTCFRKHFKGKMLDVRLCRDIPALAALFLQLSENTHMPVPPHEEAEAYGRLFGLLRQVDPEYPVTRFAREVGRSPETIRRALRYLLLPVSVREAVEKRHIRYGAAVEIQRLQEAGVKEDELHFWTLRAAVERKSVEQFRIEVSEHLAERASGQMGLLDMFEAGQAAQTRQQHVRRTVSRNTIMGVHEIIGYLSVVKRLCDERQIGPGSVYSEDSPLGVLAQATERIRELFPLLEEFMTRPRRARVSAALADTVAQLALITG